MQHRIAIAGIHTDVGKTVVSAVLAEALKAHYWKPVQAGSLDHSDTQRVQELVSPAVTLHPEALRLQMAASPHTAAAAENTTIDFERFRWPSTEELLLVETAGGLLSPMSEQHTMADFIAHYRMPVFLVLRHYLGSINHTLLCLEVMKQRNIPLLGLMVSGAADEASERFVRHYTGAGPWLYVPELEPLNAASVQEAAQQLREPLKNILS